MQIPKRQARISRKGWCIAVDTETTGLNWRKADRPFFISFTDYDGNSSSVRFDVDPFTREVSWENHRKDYAAAKELLEDPSIAKVMHNSKFDRGMLGAIGINVQGRIIDTMILAHLDEPGRELGLKPLSKELLCIDDDDLGDLKADVVNARKEGKKLGWKIHESKEADYWMADPAKLARYGVTDTERTMGLLWYFEDKMNDDPIYASLVKMEHEVLDVTLRMENRGVGVSMDKVSELRVLYDGIKVQSRVRMQELGFGDLNIHSPKQLAEVFYEKLGCQAIYRSRKGKREKTLTTDAKALMQWASEGHELATRIIQYREAEHQITNFLSVFEEEAIGDGDVRVLHPNYRTMGAVTGRLSCTSPNLMNVANSGTKNSDVELRVRECFVPRDPSKVLYLIDYAQVEVWISMFLAKDELGMKLLLDGADMHGNMARKLWSKKYDMKNPAVFKKWRKRAKYCLFGLIYGAGVEAIMATAGCSMTEAEEICKTFWITYPQLKSYMHRLQAQVNRQGWVENPFGRRYYVHSYEDYKALNYIVQGTAAEVMKRALINIDRRLTFRKTKYAPAQLLLTIHDEVMIEADRRDSGVPALVMGAMQGHLHEIVGLPCPFNSEASISTENWAKKTTLDPQPTPRRIDHGY